LKRILDIEEDIGILKKILQYWKRYWDIEDDIGILISSS